MKPNTENGLLVDSFLFYLEENKVIPVLVVSGQIWVYTTIFFV